MPTTGLPAVRSYACWQNIADKKPYVKCDGKALVGQPQPLVIAEYELANLLFVLGIF